VIEPGDPQKSLMQAMARATFGPIMCPPELLQVMIDKAEARIATLQAVINDPAAGHMQKTLCQLSLEQETAMLEIYRAAQ
jgi:hypothetical protein